ncbi:MAG: DUF1361 domain-containing protein [Verrucomicrobiae bacterium]|nr:DUF1361 domain-containing protein [Verrucomicrobiae bacterium]
MSELKGVLPKEIFAPLAALLLASAVCGVFVVVRVLLTGWINYLFLIWNLFLAWLPLVFAVLAQNQFRKMTATEKPSIRFWAWAVLWLLFLPNASYIFTDLVHLQDRRFFNFWLDLTVILSCALTGLILGFVALFLMQSVVTRRYGSWIGWGFVAISTGLSSFGIYLGRFLRFNSWDVIAKPHRLYHGISSFPLGQPQHLAFFGLFAVFLFLTYLMLYALTRLPSPRQPASMNDELLEPPPDHRQAPESSSEMSSPDERKHEARSREI